MDKEATVLFVAYEAAQERNSREKNKMMIFFLTIIIFLICGWAATVFSFLHYQSLYDYVGEEKTVVEQWSKDGDVNYSEGDINYGLSKDNKNNNETEG